MLSERDIEAAHPDAFDFVFGNLPAAKRAELQPSSHRVPLLPGRRRASTARSAGSSSSFRLTSIRQPSSKTE